MRDARLKDSVVLALTTIGMVLFAMASVSTRGLAGDEPQRSRADRAQEAAAFDAAKRAPIGQTAVPIERYAAARRMMRGMARYATAIDSFVAPNRPSPTAPNIGTWVSLGPGNIGGRTRAVVVDDTTTTPNYTIYAAGVAGGVWKSTDGGTSWTAKGDAMANLAVSALALSPTDFSRQTLFAGTGEGYNNVDAVRGAGVYQTTDGGDTWAVIADTVSATKKASFYYVNDIVFSDQNPSNVYAATNDGVWKSEDSGTTWSRILTPALPGGCLDLLYRPNTGGDVVYASCGTTQARVYRNMDAEWHPTQWTPVLSLSGMGRTTLALYPQGFPLPVSQDTDIVYAASANGANGALLAVYRSTNGGTTWAKRNGTGGFNTLLFTNADSACPGIDAHHQGKYANAIAVDPTNSNRVWVGGVNLFRSDDGGVNWGIADNSGSSDLHIAQHTLVFPPDYDGGSVKMLLVGNDGGISRVDDTTAATTTSTADLCSGTTNSFSFTSLDNGYGVTQFYYGAIYPNDTQYFGGTQGNGTVRGADGGPNAWTRILEGDGGAAAVDPTNTNTLYAENRDDGIQKSTDGGTTFAVAQNGISDTGFLTVVPFIIDPVDPQTLWTGGTALWRTSNGATDWVKASAALTGGVSAIAVAPADHKYVLAGTGGGKIYRSANGLASTGTTAWLAVAPRTGFVSSVAFDPFDKTVGYATYSTFNTAGSTVGHVWKSTDAGATWKALDTAGTTLPDIPVHAIAIDPTNTTRLYIGTDLGVFVSIDGGTTWAVENTGFPNVVTEFLKINGANLYAFTRGRGVWRVPLTNVAQTVVVEVTSMATTVTEGVGVTVPVVVRLSTSDHANTTAQATVNYATAAGTAVAGSDYTTTSGTLTFAAGSGHGTTRTVSVPIVNDALGELTESFTLQLSGVTGAQLGARTHTITILNDDPATLSLGDTTVAESNAGSVNAVLTASLIPASGSTVTVQYATANGTATAPGDYVGKTGALTFAPNVTTQTLAIAIVGDTVAEPTESFTVNLSAPTNAQIGDGTGQVTITDNDLAGTFSFGATGYSVFENAPSALITVKRSGGLASGITVSYTTENGTAVAPADYTATSGTLTFGAGVLSQTFSVLIAHDTVYELPKTVMLRLTGTGGYGAALGVQRTAVLTVKDNLLVPSTLTFGATTCTAKESGPSPVITVKRSGGTTNAVTVDYATVNGTAVAGSDYTVTNGTLSFGAGETSKTFGVTILNDSIYEPAEKFTVALSNPQPNDKAALGTLSTTTVNITDDDQAVMFSSSAYVSNESTLKAFITVKRVGGTTNTITVDYSTPAGGTAVLGTNYQAASGTLTFGPGVVSKSFTVTLLDDLGSTGSLTVNLLLSNANPASALGSPSSAILTIADSEPVVQFSAATYAAAETALKATVTVKRTSGVGVTHVNYATSNGTATAGQDYTATNGTLTFNAGVVTQTFAVSITNDTEDEAAETINLTLTAVDIPLGTPSAAIITITDNDVAGKVQFSSAVFSVDEPAGPATITVTRTGGTSSNARVNYATSNGTALSGTDYTASSGTLTFGVGETSKSFTIPITNDATVESGESVILTLSNLSYGLTLGTPSSAVLWIVSDE